MDLYFLFSKDYYMKRTLYSYVRDYIVVPRIHYQAPLATRVYYSHERKQVMLKIMIDISKLYKDAEYISEYPQKNPFFLNSFRVKDLVNNADEVLESDLYNLYTTEEDIGDIIHTGLGSAFLTKTTDITQEMIEEIVLEGSDIEDPLPFLKLRGIVEERTYNMHVFNYKESFTDTFVNIIDREAEKMLDAYFEGVTEEGDVFYREDKSYIY